MTGAGMREVPFQGGRGSPGRGPYGPGDLARRVSRRRAQLGLTRQELAGRAGLGLPYLEYLEESTARPTPAALRQLAAALQTTPAALLGAAVGTEPTAPPGGRDRPGPEPLTPTECYQLLASAGVGRVAFSTKAGPVMLPVNFAMAGRTVVFRTSADSALSAHAYDEVCFEADHLDEAQCEGWSVLLAGPAHRVTDRGELRRLQEQVTVEPWAGGARDVYVRIMPTRISGRRVHAG